MPFICWVLLMASLIKGLIKMVTATTVQNTLLISLVWVVWNLIPPTLLLWYWKFGQGRLFTVTAPRPALSQPLLIAPCPLKSDSAIAICHAAAALENANDPQEQASFRAGLQWSLCCSLSQIGSS